MKANFLILFSVVLASAGADQKSIREETSAKLRQSFQYVKLPEESSSPLINVSESKDDSEIVKMDVMSVTESFVRRDLGQALEQQAAAEIERSFAWNKGGLITMKKFGGAQADLGLWPKFEDVLTGTVSRQVLLLRVDVLRLRW